MNLNQINLKKQDICQMVILIMKILVKIKLNKMLNKVNYKEMILLM